MLPGISTGGGGLSASSSAGGNDALKTMFGDRVSYSGISGGASPFGTRVEPWHLAAAVAAVAVLLLMKRRR